MTPLRRWKFMMLVATAAVAALAVAPGAPLRAEEYNPYAGVLAAQQVPATLDGLTAFFKSLQPDDAERERQDERAAKWIAELGHDDFAVREAAQKSLVAMPFAPTARLEEAAKSADAELSYRAQAVLDATRGKGDVRALGVQAALRTMQIQKMEGAPALILASYALYDRAYLTVAARDALAATVKPADAELLRAALRSDNTEARAAAAAALPFAAPDRAAAELRPLLNDGDAKLRLAAARGLLEVKERDGLPVLVALLGSDDLPTRLAADQVLRAATGKQMGFVAYEPPEKRKLSADAWKKWIESEGASATLRVPLRLSPPELGRTLMCFFSPGQVVEIDSEGNKTWDVRIPGAMGCMGMPNGHRMVCSYSGRFVAEFDEKGKEVWKQTVNGEPYNLQRLDNGNTLLPLLGTQRVVELRPDGSTAWEQRVTGNPIDAQRLDNGNTLVVIYPTKIIEIDSKGQQVSEMVVPAPGMRNGQGGGANLVPNRAANGQPIFARRLDNGNTLVCDIGFNRVLELDPTGKEVWSKDGVNGPRSAQRLADGNTLISTNAGPLLVDPTGKTTEVYKGNSAGAAFRY